MDVGVRALLKPTQASFLLHRIMRQDSAWQRTDYGRFAARGSNRVEGVRDQIEGVEASLPFDMQGFDCDNGSEFLNWHLLRYFTEIAKSWTPTPLCSKYG